MKISLLLLMGLLLGVGGCAKSLMYDVSVTNDGSHPVTIWLTKDGPPDEAAWLSPEQVAFDPKLAGDVIAGVTVPPGKTASTGTIKGDFSSGANAILRVYEGKLTIAEILAISRGNPNRIDVVLPPGVSHWVVDDNGPLRATRAKATSPATR